MKFKVGDKVRVRQWKTLIRGFGVNVYGVVDTKKFWFSCKMKDYCGKVVTIKEVHNDYYKIVEDNGTFDWTDEVFEGYAFEYGDKIEVSDNEMSWSLAIYVGYIDGEEKPYVAVGILHQDKFFGGARFCSYHWKYARPIQNRHIITIDGKEIEISEESYKKLKESLLK